MTPATSQSTSRDSHELPLACLYAEEEIFLLPVREYLESHGCLVSVNAHIIQRPVYVIVAGSADFVKHFFATQKTSALRCLGIVIGESAALAQTLSTEKIKIAAVDARPLSNADVQSLFEFLFSSNLQFMNIKRNVHEPMAPYGAQKPLQEKRINPVMKYSSDSDVLFTQDDTRVKNLMKEIFQDTGRTRVKKKHTHVIALDVTKKILVSLAVLWCLIIAPIAVFLANIFMASLFGYAAVSSFRQSKMEHANRYLSYAQRWKSYAISSLPASRICTVLFFDEHMARVHEKYVSIVSDFLFALSEISMVATSAQEVATGLFQAEALGGHISSPASAIESVRLSVMSVHERVSLAEAEVSSLLTSESFPFTLPSVQKRVKGVVQDLSSARGALSDAGRVLSVYPKIAGFRKKQTFLLLFQNSNELRPTGGFIGSVGLLTFEEGRLSDIAIEDVYALDGQLKGHIDPPRPIAELLGQEHRYLRDSNWDPDFRESAKKALWFYEKESGNTVDGVIAISVPVLTSLLGATGPITLPDYNDRITKENFFGKSLYYTQANFFPGSTQKRDFLGQLARAMLTRITTDADIHMEALFLALRQGIAASDILMYFQHEELQRLVEYYGWGGGIFGISGCRGADESRCISQEVQIAEANLSVSKVNYYVAHSATRDIQFATDGGIQETIGYSIENTAHTLADPQQRGVGGTYQTYIRFMLPPDALVQTVLLDGVVVPTRDETDKSTVEPPYIQGEVSQNNTRIIGIALRVAPGEKKRIQLSYARTTKLQFGKGGAIIDLVWHKHPGMSDMPLKTTISYPLYWVATGERLQEMTINSEDRGLVANDGKFEYNTVIARDAIDRMKFIQ